VRRLRRRSKRAAGQRASNSVSGHKVRSC
jgi:hypothetical protein